MKLASLLSAVMLVATFSVAANDADIKKIADEAGKINQSAAKSQEKVDAIADQIDTKVQKYKSLLKEIDGLNVYNKQLEKQIANQVAEMADLNESIDKVSVIERQITPLMMRMIDGLAQFVALDVPFLKTERADRIATLREMMDRADVSPSEKFRRVMEAYQVEMDYGRTLEAYSGIQTINGQDRDVEFLRLGRTALIYQSRDGSMMGVWNKESKQWDVLDSDYRVQITKAIRMAKKQLAPDLLMLPVAITE